MHLEEIQTLEGVWHLFDFFNLPRPATDDVAMLLGHPTNEMTQKRVLLRAIGFEDLPSYCEWPPELHEVFWQICGEEARAVGFG